MPYKKYDLEKEYKKVYFIGIGGVSMNCLAQMLNNRGYIVLGSDQKESSITKDLEQKGIKVFIGHSEENIGNNGDIDLVVYNAAVKSDNVEYITALNKGIDMMTRAELLGVIMKNYDYPICIAGTHGKTTGTSMIAEIFLEAKADPTILVGGYLNSIGGTLKDGDNKFMLVESCEYYDSFLSFYPYIGIILNLEADHLDYFKDLAGVRKSFHNFAKRIPKEGTLIVNNSIENLSELTDGLECNVVTFGLKDSTWTAKNIVYNKIGEPSFDVFYKDDKIINICLSVKGEHNVLNALSIIAASYIVGMDISSISKGLENYKGTKRRFEQKGSFKGVTVIDDYAHHPTEIISTINATKNIEHNKLWCVFQPHTHSRTKNLLTEFSTAFDNADKIIILDIYSPAGREDASTHIHSKELVDLIKQRNKEVYYMSSFLNAEEFLLTNVFNNDLVLTMGAGDVYLLGESMLKRAEKEL